MANGRSSPSAPAVDASAKGQLGLYGTTLVGVSALLGAGIFVLSGVALRVAGPGALLTFLLSGLLAIVTAFSFAELAAAFPESGGSYAFAKRVFPIGGAFAAGWVLWLAYPVAAALYGLGFASFLRQGLGMLGTTLPAWVDTAVAVSVLVAGAGLQMRGGASAGSGVTLAKVVTMLVLVVPGFVLLAQQPVDVTVDALTPFLPNGMDGVLAAMTFTFIALEGFEVIAAVSDEVREPARTIPRAMFLSLGITLSLYLALLLLILTLGGSGGRPAWEELGGLGESAVTVGVQRYMGSFGVWVVIVAGLLATFTALSSALLAASRVAYTMARDRALPRALAGLGGEARTPRAALAVSLGMALFLVVVTGEVETAGATASLIFLLSFTFTNGAGLLVRVRGGGGEYKAPLYPVLPLLGITGCLALSILQVTTTPLASMIAFGWLCAGLGIYHLMFRRQAERLSARKDAVDYGLRRLRGKREPLVLVPLAKPSRAGVLTTFAHALSPDWGRVLGMAVVLHDPKDGGDALAGKFEAPQESLLRAAQSASALRRHFEGVLAVGPDVARAVRRVIRERSPEVVLFGMSNLESPRSGELLESMVRDSKTNVVIFHASDAFAPEAVDRILVPVAGAGADDPLRARVLGMFERTRAREVTLLRVVREEAERKAALKALEELAHDVGAARCVVEVGAPIEQILAHAREADLVVLGLSRVPGAPLLGPVLRALSAEPGVALLAISRTR